MFQAMFYLVFGIPAMTGVADELVALAEEGDVHLRTWAFDPSQSEYCFDDPVLATAFYMTACAVLEQHAPTASPWRLPRLEPREGANGDDIRTAIASLVSLARGINNGHLQTYESRIVAGAESDFLDQAESLLDNRGGADAAMMLVGAVLENHLRAACQTFAPNVADDAGIDRFSNAVKASQQAPRYGKNEHKQVVAIAGHRNEVAHGNFNAVAKADVEAHLAYVRRLVRGDFF